MSPKPTLQDVASAVGVSRSTVSNAYSRPDQLSSALRARIFEAARQLDYPGPDPTARSLRRGFVGTTGVLFTSKLSYAFTDPFAVRFLAGVASAAEKRGTSLLLVPLPAETAQARSAVENASVDGFCVYCAPEESWVLDIIRRRGLPFVTTAPRPDAGDDRYVGIDERAAARSVADHVAGLGHRRVALLGESTLPDAPPGPLRLAGPGDAPHPTTRGRLTGFADALAAVGVGWTDITVLNATGNSRAAAAAAVAGVFTGDDPPTAVLACSDVLALGVLDTLGGRAAEVSVTGFDDVADAAVAGLTTVRQPAEEKGRIATELLLDPPADAAAGHVLLPTELVVRTSTRPLQRS
ncbi:LacI family DNA-binding transcriptional regulator [Micromonospora sp. NPDC092111]|uniref:LacI family DNA-binding transcriptional regulator n=1 Tax=Micromonospora sp. NPDC092111 TaxID=3364289 RepID=UPI0038263DAB